MSLFGAYTTCVLLAGALALTSLTAASSDAPAADLADQRTFPDAPPVSDDSSTSARRLNKAWAEHEARAAEAAARREAVMARQNEITRAHGTNSSHARRESFLRHDSYWQRREFDSITRDPADVSAMARRGAVERDLLDTRAQLERAISGHQESLRQLDALRVR
jgi:hypothetical protein